jgi:hypothetical protein
MRQMAGLCGRVVGLLGAVTGVAPGALGQCHILDIPATGAFSTINNSTSAVYVADGGAVVVTAHVPDPFDLTLSIGSIGSAQISGVVPVQSSVGPTLNFSSDDRFLWCIGTPQSCTPPFQGQAYVGFRFQAADGLHYGWLGVFCENQGFGRVDLRFSGAAYQLCAGVAITAGLREGPAVTCDSPDFDCDGDTGTDADIEAFFRCLAGDCPAAPCANDADFNNDGDQGTDADIEAFFRVLAGGPCIPN